MVKDAKEENEGMEFRHGCFLRVDWMAVPTLVRVSEIVVVHPSDSDRCIREFSDNL